MTIVGHHPAMVEALRRVEKVATFDEPVVISGESGSGKEALAQAIYLLSPRRGRPFVVVNCPQFQEGDLTVSELFGHTRGSFTGAVADRKGCFEVADGGVIFLDEIADLHMSAQVMLLRALATGEFQRLGSTTPLSVNVRVVAATNRSLHKLGVDEGFRHDLFFRLRYFHIEVPPLRERGDDWLLLVEHFLSRLEEHYGLVRRFSSEALDLLSGHDWPGNVRELSSVVASGYALCDGRLIKPDDVVNLLEGYPNGAVGMGDSLYRRMMAEGMDFWQAVREPFMSRDLNRSQVRALIRRGLITAGGSYRRLVQDLHMPEGDYHRFMDFLRHHRLKP